MTDNNWGQFDDQFSRPAPPAAPLGHQRHDNPDPATHDQGIEPGPRHAEPSAGPDTDPHPWQLGGHQSESAIQPASSDPAPPQPPAAPQSLQPLNTDIAAAAPEATYGPTAPGRTNWSAIAHTQHEHHQQQGQHPDFTPQFTGPFHGAPPQQQPQFPPPQNFSPGQFSNQQPPQQNSHPGGQGGYANPSEPASQLGWQQGHSSAAFGQPGQTRDASTLLARLSAEVQAPPKPAEPSKGWRRWIYKGTGGLVNPGLSKAEEKLLASIETITGPLVGDCYKIAVLVGNGGAGKSTVTTLIGSTFAEMRSDDRIIAVDADPSLGKLANRIAPSTASTYWELLGDEQAGLLQKWNDVKHRLGSNSTTGLWMVRGDFRTDVPRRLITPQSYQRTIEIIDRYMSIAMIDCGQFLEHEVMPAILDDADAVVVVGALEQGGTEAAGQTLQWLETADYRRLLAKTVVVLNDPWGRSTKKAQDNMVREFTTHTDVKTVVLPFDPHLSSGGVIDTAKGVSKKTREASIEIATHLAKGFADTLLESGRQ